MKNAETIEELAQRAGVLTANRPMHTFNVPPGLHIHGVKVVGLVELTASEEVMASKRVGTDLTRLATEHAKESLRMINGKRLSAADGSIDQEWEKLHPKIRTLVTMAFNKIHHPVNEELQGFLESHQLQVG